MNSLDALMKSLPDFDPNDAEAIHLLLELQNLSPDSYSKEI
jgi:hypothetical protein